MGEKRLVVFNVTVELDPEAYAQEYGEPIGSAAASAAGYAFQALRSRMVDGVTVNGVTVPSFAANNGHWAKMHLSEYELLPVHRDGLAPGTRNPYDSGRGMFKALCVCGQEFWGIDPDDAEFQLSEHCEELNGPAPHAARPDDSPVRMNRCAECGATIEPTGPNSWRHVS